MMRAMVHRGPDDEGYAERPLGADGGGMAAGFGFRRLAILDLSPTGHQPMVNPATGDVIVFNGEIYNYADLRARLLAKGHAFHSTGDSEVLLHALSEWGEAALDEIDGMFAFGKADLTPVGKSRIENMIEGMRQAGITGLTSISVIGHTDPIGSASFNQTLSEERAGAVKAYLVSRGIPASVITAEGRGASQLRITEEACRAKGQGAPRSTLIACLAPNRRVEVIATAVQGPKP
jgi:outer membrane protein OmpA-like peptidoglycan-associated protein